MLAVSLLGAGCSSKHAAPRHSPSPSRPAPSPARPAPSSSASATPRLSTYTQAQLASRPCLALDGHDLAALGISGRGEPDNGRNGAACGWELDGQHVSLDLDVPLSFAKTMTKGGRVSQVPVGRHEAVQAEFQGICFIFVAVHDTDHLLGTTTIPSPGESQDGACPAGASVAAAALSHIR